MPRLRAILLPLALGLWPAPLAAQRAVSLGVFVASTGGGLEAQLRLTRHLSVVGRAPGVPFAARQLLLGGVRLDALVATGVHLYAVPMAGSLKCAYSATLSGTSTGCPLNHPRSNAFAVVGGIELQMGDSARASLGFEGGRFHVNDPGLRKNHWGVIFRYRVWGARD